MVISKDKTEKRFSLKIGDETIKQVQRFNYLGSMITKDAKCDQKIRKRIGMAKTAFENLKSILKNNKLS